MAFSTYIYTRISTELFLCLNGIRRELDTGQI